MSTPEGDRVARATTRLKYCTSRSCFSAARREPKVPTLRRLPVLGLTLRECSRHLPRLSLRVIDGRR